MEAYLWDRASLLRSILAHISHSNKPPIYGWNRIPEIRKEASRKGMVASRRGPREYRLLKAERDGKPDEQQEMFGKR
jgi:hypothetical protein